MTGYELLAVNENLLKKMQSAALSVDDIKYMEMYREYERLRNEGHKKTYIMQYLSDEYEVSERTVYRIVDRFSATIAI
jgi:hypothetical protein|nr:MAG TPA_asm: Mor transcription activator family [Caudoviricetes sp.]